MTNIIRQSAVQFEVSSKTTEDREAWSITLEYQNEGQGPWLVDLAHKNRFDLQSKKINELILKDVAVPTDPGSSILENNMLINRMNETQVSICFLGREKPEITAEGPYTDITENTVFLALFGPNAFFIAEKLTALDFFDPDNEPPFLYQGPFCHVPCQIVTLQRGEDGLGGILLTCSRGYAESMVNAILDSGAEFGLRPAGEDKFTAWLETI